MVAKLGMQAGPGGDHEYNSAGDMARRRRRRPQTEECPHCGTTFRHGRLACPECGSDARTGWNSAEQIDYASVEIPDTYEELVEGAPRRRSGPGKGLIVLVLVLAVLTLTWLIRMF